MRVPLNRVEWAGVAFAVIVAHAFLVHEWLYPSAWDATQYLHMGREIAERGMFSKIQGYEMRPWGYPVLLSLVLRAADATGVSFVALLFELQLLAYVTVAYYLRSALVPASPVAARIAFCGLLVNFYVLIYMPESLTESVSLTLLVLAAGFWVTLWRRGLAVTPLVAGGLTIGFALMVRPANLFMVAVWLFGIAVVALRQRPGALRAAIYAGMMLVFLALPITPQIRNNIVHFGEATPLVTFDIGQMQQIFGIVNLKYATAMPPVPEPAVHYKNPLYDGSDLTKGSALAWYVAHPLAGVATIALHTFNLVDQDLLFTYSRDLTPWYRVPLGIVNHAVVALGIVGLVLLGQRVRNAKEARWRDAYVVLLALMVTNWAVYVWTAVEMRFGSVLLLVLFPLAGYAAMRLAAVNSMKVKAGVVCGIAAYVVLAMLLSGWVREQSRQIRDYRTSRTEPVGLRGAGEPCCARATGFPRGKAALDPQHSHPPGFAG